MTVNPDLITEATDPNNRNRTERVKPLPSKKIHAAQRLVASYAEDADDCRLLLAMLGLDDSGPPLCRECGEPIARLAAGGYSQAAGDGLCARHYDKRRGVGLFDSRGRCNECGASTGGRKRMRAGEVERTSGGRGMCERCYKRAMREEVAL